MLVGLEDISDGTVQIDGEPVNDLAPRDRNLAMVFQNYALYPHLTVFQNIAFPLRLNKGEHDEEDVKKRVHDASSLLELDEHLDRKPGNLSGGQRQRVAMGRAIVRHARAFLFDEPLSNLDAKLRGQMRTEIARLQRRLGTTTVYVTHDQTEAMTLGDRVAVLRKGELQQVASPRGLYDEPVNLFVAGFIGSPPMNFLPGEISEGVLHLPIVGVPLDEGLKAAVGDRNLVIVGARKSTRLNSSHVATSYAGSCLQKQQVSAQAAAARDRPTLSRRSRPGQPGYPHPFPPRRSSDLISSLPVSSDHPR